MFKIIRNGDKLTRDVTDKKKEKLNIRTDRNTHGKTDRQREEGQTNKWRKESQTADKRKDRRADKGSNGQITGQTGERKDS